MYRGVLGACAAIAVISVGAISLALVGDDMEVVLPLRVGTHGTVRFDVANSANGVVGEVGGAGPESDDEVAKSDSAIAEPEHPWSLNVSKVGIGKYEGEVRFLGVPEFEAGTLYAQVDWPNVHGTVVDNEGRNAAEFDGTLSLTGEIEGQFATVEGKRGVWHLNAPPEE